MIWGKAVGLIGFQPMRRGDEVDRYVELEFRRESADHRETMKREIRKGLTSFVAETK